MEYSVNSSPHGDQPGEKVYINHGRRCQEEDFVVTPVLLSRLWESSGRRLVGLELDLIWVWRQLHPLSVSIRHNKKQSVKSCYRYRTDVWSDLQS